MVSFLTILCALSATVSSSNAAEEKSSNIGGAVVIDGAWRFTAVTDLLVRIEYDPRQRFVDAPTEAFRRSPPRGTWAPAALRASDGVFTAALQTSGVHVQYKRSATPSKNSVLVTSRSDSTHLWHWGDDPAEGNLRGTARTMDSNAETLDLNCNNKVSPTMDNSQMHCTWGLISRAGWAAVNDTGSPTWQNGWYVPSENTIDVSIFMHGLDFAGALEDFVYASGPPALPPRYALGTIFTRWFNFDSMSVRTLVNDFESRSMPLDAWIFDMNWHLFGPWGSFTWNDVSYPDLQNLLAWMKERRLPIGANTHDHDGIAASEKTYHQMCEALGRSCNGETLPFDLYNRTYALAQEDIAWRALQTQGDKQGLDFAWIDYQQGEEEAFEKTKIPGINPTIVLNRLRATDAQRHGENKRPMILSRWGGLGNHKYPVGFSGDQYHTWKGLEFLPYFTSTAANVAYGYWSHDTVGGDHDLADDYEFSVRWYQTSAWSPILRMHDKGAGTGGCATSTTCARVVPWDIPNDYFKAIRKASWQRDELVPYMYTAAFNASSTGLVLVRPMYYENPREDALYGLPQQYLFGPDMIVSPISKPSSSDAKGQEHALGAVVWSVYIPESINHGWVDRLNGDFAQGETVTEVYGIADVPSFVRQGAVIPMRPWQRGETSLARAASLLTMVDFRIAPAEAFYTGGVVSRTGVVVDDDGITTDFMDGKYSKTECSYTFDNGVFKFTLSRSGDFEGKPAKLSVRLSFPQMPPVLISRSSSKASVAYDDELLGPVVTLLDVDLDGPSAVEIELQVDPSYTVDARQAFVGLLGRVRRGRYAKDALDDLNVPYGDARSNLTSYVLAGPRMSPVTALALPSLWKGAVAQVQALLASDKSLNADSRRHKFVSDMMNFPGSAYQQDIVV
eukprot:TRINITY_DN22546_c0_g3_i1.p1 TRINITY_DN22546_c0_g3~~TRINITY_DN22546_c0_g3_i1.p1  ORF type:complete len:903 (-),score=95.05 TRINITY_DN22546_c0_g3_i1:79-2787(-)